MRRQHRRLRAGRRQRNAHRGHVIVECGVNTDVYERVDVNGTPIEGTSGAGYPANRKDYGIDDSTTDDRARVKYTNAVDPHALRTMTVVKKLFKEDGVTPIPYESDDINFSFRLYLASEFDTLKEANMHTYHVRNPKGEYCGWDTPGQKFYSLGKTNYDDLTDAEKEAASFTTSIYGIIAKIPADHKVEIRNILAGTQFRILERSNDIPDGYSYHHSGHGSACGSPQPQGLGTAHEQGVVRRVLYGSPRAGLLWRIHQRQRERRPDINK